MERALDKLLTAIREGSAFEQALRDAARLAELHYRSEAPLLSRIAGLLPAVAEKLSGQHAEALEIAARFDESLAAGQNGDALALARRFHAIAQHNIIEEERDVFPLAKR